MQIASYLILPSGAYKHRLRLVVMANRPGRAAGWMSLPNLAVCDSENKYIIFTM